MNWMKLIVLFSTLNENKFIDLIFYGSDKYDDKWQKEPQHFSVHHKIHQDSQIWQTPAIIIWVLTWSEYVYIYVYSKSTIFCFVFSSPRQ